METTVVRMEVNKINFPERTETLGKIYISQKTSGEEKFFRNFFRNALDKKIGLYQKLKRKCKQIL